MKYIDAAPPVQTEDKERDISKLISFDGELKEELNQILREIYKKLSELSSD